MNYSDQNQATAAQTKKEVSDIQVANVLSPVNGGKAGKKLRVTSFQQVMTCARRLFDRQIEKSSDMKRKCIDYCVGRYYNDPLRFWEEFKTRRDEILDRVSFNKRCEAADLKPQFVAEHLLMEGNARVKAVLKDGFAPLNGAHVMFNAAIYEDKQKLHEKKDASKEATPTEDKSEDVPAKKE